MTSMALYLFCFLDEFDHLVGGQFANCRDDEEARRCAHKLLVSGNHDTIELWQGDQWICRMKKGGKETEELEKSDARS